MTDAPESNAVTADEIEEMIEAVQHAHFPDTTVTVCVITLTNGFTTVGHSACVDPNDFDAQMGREIAFRNAWDAIWPLAGFLRREILSREEAVEESVLELAEAHEDLEYALSRRISV